MIWNRILSLTIGCTLGAASALANSTHSTTNEACSAVLVDAADETQVREIFANWEKNFDQGLANRGYMGNSIPNNPFTNRIAFEYGLVWWGVALRFVKDLETAHQHRQSIRELYKKKNSLFTDKIVTSLYLIGDESELGLTFAENAEQGARLSIPPEVVERILKRGAYEISDSGEVTFYPGAQLLSHIGLTPVEYNLTNKMPATGFMNSITQQGWVTFKWHGIHDYNDWSKKDSFAKIYKVAQNLLDHGFTVRFDHDYEAALKMLATQERSYTQEEKDNEGNSKVVRKVAPESMNRYSRPEVFETALGRLKNGEGYSVEIYSADGHLVGGEIGFRHGNHLMGDSVFYDRGINKKQHGIDGVDIAKAAGLILMKYMAERGQPYTDPGMITPYTASMGADLVYFTDFRQKIKSGPQEIIQLPKTLDLRDETYWHNQFQAVAKLRGRALTSEKLLTRLPIANAEAAEIAQSYGLTRKNLKVVFVPTIEAAQADVAQYRQPSDLPLYLVGNFQNDSQRNWKSTVERVIYIKHSRYPQQFQDIPIERMTELFPPLASGQDVVDITQVNGWTTLLIPVWAIALP